MAMQRFASGHAGHPDWRMALALAAAQVDAALARDPGTPTLGLVYFTDAYASQAPALLAALCERWPGTAWAGSVGVGVAACGAEYFDEPALALLLTDLPATGFELFSGARPLRRADAVAALVHADPATPELAELIVELADRTTSHYLFGGLAASRERVVHIADGAWHGGLSGVAFGAEVALVSRVTQGCQPVGPERTVTASDRNVVLALDGQPALRCLLRDLGLPDGADPRQALPRLQGTLVGLSDARRAPPSPRRGAFGDEVRVRHLVGLDPLHQALAIADVAEPGQRLAFCRRDVQAARRDLVRICSEIREEVEAPHELAAVAADEVAQPARRMRGAVYVSCAGRGGPHFGAPSAELRIVQQALGDVPLAGFFAGGEIAHHHVHGYTGVLTVFVGDA